tara:strand:+ start:15973 stop:17340 length:1368 start_codon:yes stop_codon:yes gene_type:complete
MRGRALGRGRLIRRRNKKGTNYVGDWTDADGRRRREVLSSDRRVAERMLGDIIRKRDLEIAGLGIEDSHEMLVADLKAQYLADLKLRVTAGHVTNIKSRFKRIFEAVKARRVSDLRPGDVLAFRRQRVADGSSNRTANLDVAALKGMLNWAVDSGILGTNPLAKIKPLPQGKKHQRYRRRAMTESEVELFLQAAAEDDAEQEAHVAADQTIDGGSKGKGYAVRKRVVRVPQFPLWLALIETGARWGALTQVLWQDLDDEVATLRLRAETAKGEREQVNPIPIELLDELQELRAIHAEVTGLKPLPSDCIFLTPRGESWGRQSRNAMRIFDRLLERAELEKVDTTGEKLDIHALRHTFGTRLLRAGVGLHQVQKLMGHSSPALTAQVYAHLATDDLRDAVSRMPTVDGGGARKLPRGLPGTKLAQGPGGLSACAHKPLSGMERVIGIEPTTFSLGS